MKIFTFLLLIVSLSFCMKSNAQTAVYYCGETGYYGYCYGKVDAQNCAYNACIKSGGKSPRLVGSVVYNKGYGAIALGKTSYGGNALGASAGLGSQDEADRTAINFCRQSGGQTPYIDVQFYDGSFTSGNDGNCCCQYETYDYLKDGTKKFREYCYYWTTSEKCYETYARANAKVVYKSKDECKCVVPK